MACVGLLGPVGCGPSPKHASLPVLTIEPLFEDATAALGLDFIHDSGATGQYFMWEQMASGAAVFDFNNDDRLDLYFVQCGGPTSTNRNRLYRQESNGRFTDVSEGSGLDVADYGMGAIAGDINNDGWSDIVLTGYGATRLFLNNGDGSFREITATSGIDNPRWATAASFLDFDRDGWLDLVVVNYVDYDPERECRDHLGAREYCGPQDFPGTVSRLYRNLARSEDATFEDVTVASGIAKAGGPGLGVLCADFDGDGWPDIFICDDGRPNRLFMNQRDGTFREEGAIRGLAYNAMGSTAGNMGVAVGDVNGDGLFDVFVTHLVHEQHSFWVQGPRGLFQDQIAERGFINSPRHGTGFGAVLADLNLDGLPDLALVNGRVLRGEEAAPRLAGLHSLWQPYAQRNQIFINEGNGRFSEVSDANLPFAGRAGVGRGLAMADLDNDGDVDLITTCTGGPAQVFRNVIKKRGHWLTLRAVDPRYGGRDAIGAELVVNAGGRQHWGIVQPSSSFLVSHDPRVHYGLGNTTVINGVHVRWPDGFEEFFEDVQVDRHVVLARGSGTSIQTARFP